MTIHSYWFLTFLLTLIFLSLQPNSANNDIKCIDSERQSLLSFNHDLVDRSNILSSWNEENGDCCNWTGVRCSNNTGHIISLDLHGPYDYVHGLEGKIGSSLINLSHLIYLDLSFNSFDQISLFQDIDSLVNLKYLNLSHNSLTGVIPPQLGNLSKLSTLDLQFTNFNNDAYNSFAWVSNLSSLKHLFLSGVGFGGAHDWTSVISKLTLLKSLSLDYCNLPQPILFSSHSSTNFSRFLSKLNLAGNNLNSSIFPWLLNFRNSLVHLDLSFNNLQGLTMNDFRSMTSLEFLELSFTYIDFSSPTSFRNLCDLKTLSLSSNNIGGLLSDFLKKISHRALNSLQYLNLASNNFQGALPNFTMLPSLKELDLSNNALNGTIPRNIGQLSNLVYLYLHQNLLTGEIYEAHFTKLTNLRDLTLFQNSLILNFKSDWIPPFQLEYILLGSCNLGPSFPKWLQTQNFSVLDISNTKISDVIPYWFWNNLSPGLEYLDLSENKIKGEIPNLSVKLRNIMPFMINLKSNEFFGQIPSFLLQGRWVLDLSNNKFSSIATGLCHEVMDSPLYGLDLSNNQLSGQLPDCWDHMPHLRILNLGNNTFSGAIPSSMGSLHYLYKLNFRNNQFSGELPHWFNFTNLEVFDVMHNRLSGIIPSWIGFEWPSLVRLNLKANHFHGILPSSLCNLRNIEILDISSNNITGTIPTCIHNFSVLTGRSNSYTSYVGDIKFNYFFYHYLRWRSQFENFFTAHVKDDMDLVWKGQDKIIAGGVLPLQRSIDMSCNHLSGEIPNEIAELADLISLNLSSNNLTGQIPNKIDQLHLLESLDLSKNHLFGQIPPSFSQISTLSVLNLSYNNLSGKIPLGTQLQSFKVFSYEGNPYLCGAPLNKCYEADIQDQFNISVRFETKNEDELIIRELFICISLGFVVGFWGIFSSLVLHKKWGHAYFNF